MAKAGIAEPSTAAQAVARKWRRGVDAFLEEIEPVLEEIRDHARTMPHETPADSEAVVAFTVDRLKRFSKERHEQHARGE